MWHCTKISLGFDQYGFAAGCEAWLCRAVATPEEILGYALVRARPGKHWAKPEPRAQPLFECNSTARHSRASHQAAKPQRSRLK